MTGGFSPWSKFNAHSWSVLNARRQASPESLGRRARLTLTYRLHSGISKFIDPVRYCVFRVIVTGDFAKA
jgi:hypothetical protein